MVNTQLLEEKIESSGLKISDLCEQLDISRQAFDKKRKGLISFKVPEVFLLGKLLKLSAKELKQIFDC